MKNDYWVAFYRTLMPFVFGLVVGVGGYYLFSYLPPIMLVSMGLGAVAVYLFISLFNSNLETIQREKQ